MPACPAFERPARTNGWSVANLTFVLLAVGIIMLPALLTSVVPVTPWSPFHQAGPTESSVLALHFKWSGMLFYPFTLLHLFSPPSAPWLYFDLFHGLVAAAGICLVLWRETTKPVQALMLGTAVLAFAGLRGGAMEPALLAAFTWVPWLWLLAEPALRDGGRDLVLCGALAAIQLLTGAAALVIVTWLCILLWIGGAVAQAHLQGAMAFKRMLAWVALSVLLAATQVVPLLNVLPKPPLPPPGINIDVEQQERPVLVQVGYALCGTAPPEGIQLFSVSWWNAWLFSRNMKLGTCEFRAYFELANLELGASS